MKSILSRSLGLLSLCSLLATPALMAQATQEKAGEQFAAPKMIMAGQKTMGEARLYPSPTLHDVNGDGKLDMVIGDLFGHVTVALNKSEDGKLSFGPDKKLKDDKGENLKFQNW